MKKITFISILLATVAITGCYYYGPCLDGSGQIVAEFKLQLNSLLTSLVTKEPNRRLDHLPNRIAHLVDVRRARETQQLVRAVRHPIHLRDDHLQIRRVIRFAGCNSSLSSRLRTIRLTELVIRCINLLNGK